MVQGISTLSSEFGSGVYFGSDLLDLSQLLHLAQSEFGVSEEDLVWTKLMSVMNFNQISNVLWHLGFMGPLYG